MKIFMTFISLCFALSVFACPELSGSFQSCKVEGYYPGFDMKSLRISQKKNDLGVMIFTFDLETQEGELSVQKLVANGLPEVTYETEDETRFKITKTSTCEESALVNHEKVEVEDMGFSMEATESFTLKEDKLEIQVQSLGEVLAIVICE